MDELEAMNMLLRAIGSSPVNSLETPHPDAINAKATLNRWRKQVQAKGWWCNVDYTVTFTRDAVTGEIPVATHITKAVFQDSSIVIRGNKLYNKAIQSYVFTTNPTAVRIQYDLSWAELPASLQRHAAYAAAAQFVMDEIEDAAKSSYFKEQAGIAYVDVKSDDLSQRRLNVFDKTRVYLARKGVRPYLRQGF